MRENKFTSLDCNLSTFLFTSSPEKTQRKLWNFFAKFLVYLKKSIKMRNSKVEIEKFTKTMNLIGDCSICLTELLGVVRILPCWHKFHESCLLKWFQVSSRCPCCRMPLKRQGRKGEIFN